MTQPSLPIFQEIVDTMKSTSLTGTLGIWGALISTVLLVIKIIEMWRERLHLSASYRFSDRDHGGNEIIIQNPSKTPVLISHWELLWRKRRPFRTETTQTLDYGFPEDRRDITIAAHSTYTLRFTEQNYFEWGCKTRDKGILYIELHIVGRKIPLLLHIYDPSR